MGFAPRLRSRLPHALTPEAVADWNALQRDLATLRALDALHDGRPVSALDALLAAPEMLEAFGVTPQGRVAPTS